MEMLTQLLASDDLNALPEETAFEAAMLWLKHHPERRQWIDMVSLVLVSLVATPLDIGGIRDVLVE